MTINRVVKEQVFTPKLWKWYVQIVNRFQIDFPR